MTIVVVVPFQVGEKFPAEVRAELTFDLAGAAPQVRREWDGLRCHDVVFCLAVAAPIKPLTVRPETLSPAQVREGFGIVAVRGAEVTELLDQDGVCISEPNPLKRRCCCSVFFRVYGHADTKQLESCVRDGRHELLSSSMRLCL